jgi:adenine-specific DNA-methyltransferase
MAQVRKADLARRKILKHALAKTLRANSTDAERILWFMLRGKRLAAPRFRRQQAIGPYIVDFFCPSAKLVVELDGGQHGTDQNIAYDENRTRFLEAKGYRVFRFWNAEVMKHRDVVAEAIYRTAQSLLRMDDPSH